MLLPIFGTNVLIDLWFINDLLIPLLSHEVVLLLWYNKA